MAKPQLLREGGVTQTSLKNERRLSKRLGRPVRVELHYDPDGADWYIVRAFYDSGDQHDFTGFSWGYGGEGPRGLLEFCQRNNIPLSEREIANLNNRDAGVAWVFPPMEEEKEKTYRVSVEIMPGLGEWDTRKGGR